ncbi:hypothetical protein HDU93_001945 [Gonapodya sp. JEL0774]|nr:hypothetical protein HDU93_001945 [Gonapodya sp. JEL0774]
MHPDLQPPSLSETSAMQLIRIAVVSKSLRCFLQDCPQLFRTLDFFPIRQPDPSASRALQCVDDDLVGKLLDPGGLLDPVRRNIKVVNLDFAAITEQGFWKVMDRCAAVEVVSVMGCERVFLDNEMVARLSFTMALNAHLRKAKGSPIQFDRSLIRALNVYQLRPSTARIKELPRQLEELYLVGTSPARYSHEGRAAPPGPWLPHLGRRQATLPMFSKIPTDQVARLYRRAEFSRAILLNEDDVILRSDRAGFSCPTCGALSLSPNHVAPEIMSSLRDLKKESHPHLQSVALPEIQPNFVITDFFPFFDFIYQLTDDEESVRYVARRVIDEFAKDGVRYLELRSTPRANEKSGMTKESYVRAILDVLCDSRAEHITLSHGTDRTPHLIVRFIPSIDRRSTKSAALDTAELALRLRDDPNRGEYIVGVDVCGDPTRGDFANVQPAIELLNAARPPLPTTIHCGEVARADGEATVMLASNPGRIGHATFLSSDERKEIVRKRLPSEYGSGQLIHKHLIVFLAMSEPSTDPISILRASSVASLDLPDKRVCWICYADETLADREQQDPTRPPNSQPFATLDVRWVRPCRCTGSLRDVHERCLLKWRYTQTSSSSDSNNALKCPACKTTYKFEEPSDILLDALNSVDRSISQTTPYLALSLAFISLYIVLVSHGAYSMVAFLGPRASARILTPSGGTPSWRLWTGLPMIPAALVAARLEGFEMWLLAAPWICVEDVFRDVVHGLQRFPPSEQGLMVMVPWARLAYRFTHKRALTYLFPPAPQTIDQAPIEVVPVAPEAADGDRADEVVDVPNRAAGIGPPPVAGGRQTPARVLALALLAPSIATACGAALGWGVTSLRELLGVTNATSHAGLPFAPFPNWPVRLSTHFTMGQSLAARLDSILASLELMPPLHKNILGLGMGIFLRDCLELDVDICGCGFKVIQNHDTASALWDASVALASHVLSLPPETFHGRTVIEIGAGCALPGIAIAKYCKPERVILTDLADEISLLQANVCANGLGPDSVSKVEVIEYFWGTEPTWLEAAPDYVLAADVVYEIQHFQELVKALSDLSRDKEEQQTIIIMAMEHRWKDVEEEFWRLMASAGFVHKTVERRHLDPQFVPLEIDVYVIRRKGKLNTGQTLMPVSVMSPSPFLAFIQQYRLPPSSPARLTTHNWMDSKSPMSGQYGIPVSEMSQFWRLYADHCRNHREVPLYLTENIQSSVVRPFFDVDFPFPADYEVLSESSGLSYDEVTGVIVEAAREAMAKLLDLDLDDRHVTTCRVTRRLSAQHKLHLHFPLLVTAAASAKVAALHLRRILEQKFLKLADQGESKPPKLDWETIVDDQVYASSLRLFGSLKSGDNSGLSKYGLLTLNYRDGHLEGIAIRHAGEMTAEEFSELSIVPSPNQQSAVECVLAQERYESLNDHKVSRTMALARTENDVESGVVRIDGVSRQAARVVLDHLVSASSNGELHLEDPRPSRIIGAKRDHFGKDIVVALIQRSCPFDKRSHADHMLEIVYVLYTPNGCSVHCRACDIDKFGQDCNVQQAAIGAKRLVLPKHLLELLDKRHIEGYVDRMEKWKTMRMANN